MSRKNFIDSYTLDLTLRNEFTKEIWTEKHDNMTIEECMFVMSIVEHDIIEVDIRRKEK